MRQVRVHARRCVVRMRRAPALTGAHLPTRTMASTCVNHLGQPVGFAMDGWSPPPFPPHQKLTGRYCQLEPLRADQHAESFWSALSDDASDARWTYMPYGPFASVTDFAIWCREAEQSIDPQYYAVVVDGQAVGIISYLRIVPAHGVIEVGHVHFSPRLARTRAATETMYLLTKNAFELGYRRYEWKCDSCNLPSCAAAARLGFTYEGTFRQAIVYKGRSRDTTWFSIIDGDWKSGLKEVYERWLDTSNFDEAGQQTVKLSDVTARFVHAKP